MWLRLVYFMNENDNFYNFISVMLDKSPIFSFSIKAHNDWRVVSVVSRGRQIGIF